MATATETKARYIELVARPISILPTDAARIYAFIHPSVLGLYFIARFPALADPEPYVPAPAFVPQTLVDQRDTNQSHLRMIYRPDIAVSDVRERAALSIYSTLLGGSMGSRLFEEIREKRGLCYSVSALNHSFADVPILQLSSGLESGKCVEAYTRMREIVDELRAEGPRKEEVQRARAYAAGRTVLGFENTNAVARHAASQQIVFGEDIDPDAATYDEVREVATGVADNLAVACVGPHSAEEF